MKKLLAGISFVAIMAALYVSPAAAKGEKQAELLDINSASLAQMVTIGVDMGGAQKIVAGRPWASKNQIKGKAVSDEVYAKVADKITAKQAKLTGKKK